MDGWISSSFSNNNGACVEVKFATPDTILVRDSKDRGVVLRIITRPSRSWAALLKKLSKA
jgi:hypothetical protein